MLLPECAIADSMCRSYSVCVLCVYRVCAVQGVCWQGAPRLSSCDVIGTAASTMVMRTRTQFMQLVGLLFWLETAGVLCACLQGCADRCLAPYQACARYVFAVHAWVWGVTVGWVNSQHAHVLWHAMVVMLLSRV